MKLYIVRDAKQQIGYGKDREMRKPFKLLREAAVEVAETLGVALDEDFTISSEGYEFERYEFTIRQLSIPWPLGIEFKLSISGDDIDAHFEGAP